MDLHDMSQRIKDVWDGGTWRLERVWSWLPELVKARIRTTSVRLNERVPDGVRWSGHVSGQYSTSSGYAWIMQQRGMDTSDHDMSWTWIWKLGLPLKCIVLVWLGVHDSLPTNSCRFRRGMADSEVCALCNSHPETALHCLRDCLQARGIWQRAGFDVNGTLFQEGSVWRWLRGLLVDASPTAMATLWWIWRSRNSVCLEGTRIPDLMIASNIAIMAEDISRAFARQLDAPHRAPQLVRWLLRVADDIILNVDGSVCGSPSRGGFGGCYRTSQGEWKGGFYGFLQDDHILHLELLAIFHGLSFAWDRGYRLVECQSDSLDAVNLVLSVPPSTHLYAAVVWDIKGLLDRPWSVDFHHTLREGNASADYLAKFGAQQDVDLVFVENPLAGMSLLLLADAIGISSLRA